MVEYRQTPEDRAAEFREMRRYAFSPEEGPRGDGDDGDDGDDEDASEFVRRGLFEGENA